MCLRHVEEEEEEESRGGGKEEGRWYAQEFQSVEKQPADTMVQEQPCGVTLRPEKFPREAYEERSISLRCKGFHGGEGWSSWRFMLWFIRYICVANIELFQEKFALLQAKSWLEERTQG